MTREKTERRSFAEMVTTVALGYVSHNRVASGDLGTLITTIQTSLRAALDAESGQTPGDAPAVSIKKSYGDDFLICLEDGRRLTMLKRYLRTHHQMSPDEYRRKWNLPPDYPMVAPAYSRMRAAFAKKAGLGTIPGSRRRGRKPKPAAE